MRTCLSLAALRCCCGAAAPPAGAAIDPLPEVDSPGTITGQVIEAGSHRVVPNASVIVPGAKRGGMSDEGGTFRITRIPAGRHAVRVAPLGGQRVELTVDVHPGSNPPLRVEIGRIGPPPRPPRPPRLDSHLGDGDFDCVIRPERAGIQVAGASAPPHFEPRDLYSLAREMVAYPVDVMIPRD